MINNPEVLSREDMLVTEPAAPKLSQMNDTMQGALLTQQMPKYTPGLMHYWTLNQTEVWVNVHGHEISLDDMSDDYLTRAIWHLRDKSYWLFSDMIFNLSMNAVDGDQEAADQFKALDADYGPLLGYSSETTAETVKASYAGFHRWLDSQPLVAEMIRRLGESPTERLGPRGEPGSSQPTAEES